MSRRTAGWARKYVRCWLQRSDAHAAMKLHWMFAMLSFIHMPAHADSIAQGEAVWVLDPAVPGPDVPDRGSSQFDKITLDAHGQRHVPFPFEHLVARIEAAADCNAAQPCTRTVLIPLGRSLQRAAASPDFFAHPRRVLAVTEEGSGTLLRDRLYLGFQE